jgi:Fur family transcriptional regulator, zinc uptake regulator
MIPDRPHNHDVMQAGTAQPLSRNNQLVLDRLTHARGALSAYDLLDGLRDEGLRAPPQIYRALKVLAEQGLVHRLESTNTYIACAHATCCGGQECRTSHTLFFLCDECGSVREVNGQPIARDVDAMARQIGFAARHAALEVRGQCADCAQPAKGNTPSKP